jgi:hypothetical protein
MSTQVALSLALPKWTRRVAVDDGGRDPLGEKPIGAMLHSKPPQPQYDIPA